MVSLKTLMVNQTLDNPQQEAKQVGKFGAVGVINTLLDFTLFNLLTQYLLFPAVASNIVSTGTAMTFSFFANKVWVFSNQGKEIFKQAVLFISVTLFGLWVIQTGIIFILQQIWTWPLEFGYSIVELVRLDGILDQKLVFDNGAKVIGTFFSMVWNYLLYKKVVFPHGKPAARLP